MSVRFAPSPTGKFHVGNFRTAWISHLWARKLSMPWIVRFEDIDKPRVMPGAQEQQLAEMKQLGLMPDQVLVQSHQFDRHWKLFQRAVEEGMVYPCYCSRKELQQALSEAASAPHGMQPVYNGRCRDIKDTPAHTHPSLAWRLRSPAGDGSQDFIVARTSPGASPGKDSFVPSYNWACAIDDYDGGHALLVRAADLHHVADQQRLVHAWLSRAEKLKPFPAVFHCALVTQDDGHRLEKRTQGVTLPELLLSHPIAEIIERFERSFPFDPASYAPEKIWGEPKERLTLSELLVRDPVAKPKSRR